MPPHQDIAGSFLKKTAIAARLFGKELRRNKLKWFDLRRAEYRLGEKAYASGAANTQEELVLRLDSVARGLTQLRQQEIKPVSNFGEKVKAVAGRVSKTVQVGALELKRRHLLRQVGANLRQTGAPNSLAEQAQAALAVVNRMSSLDAEIKELAPQTYVWARRPLLLVFLLLFGTLIAGGFTLRHQSMERSALSKAQMDTIIAQQQQALVRQMQQMMVTQTQQPDWQQPQKHVAEAERQYREQRERERVEAEKRQREEAAERERVAAAERARVEQEQREQERRMAVEKARKEQQQQREAQEQRAKADAIARAEQETKQQIRKVAQAFEQALAQNDLRLASSVAIGDEKQLTLAKAQDDFALSFVRMRVARAKKFGGDQAGPFFDSSWSKAEEQLDGDKATVTNGMISYRLEKSDQTWKVSLPEAGDSTLVSVASSLTHGVDQITSKVEKGEYKNDEEAENAFKAELAAATTAQTSRTRSEDSLAVERFLRSQLIGGMTENQIVQVSDIIAEKLDVPELSEVRKRCFKTVDGQRVYDDKMLYSLSQGMYVRATEFPAVKSQAKQLNEEIGKMFPRRAVFKNLLREYKALPPIDEPIQLGPRAQGSLVMEHLETFQSAMLRLGEVYLAMRPYTGESRLSLYDKVKSLKAGDVLCCAYESEVEYQGRPYFFWYHEKPPGLDELLKTIPNEHPIHQIGPPLDEAPPTLDLAMQANVETAQDVKKMIAESRARAEKEALKPKGTSYERGRDIAYKALGVLGMLGVGLEAMNQHDVAAREAKLQEVIAASGGTKVQCPECKGRGKILRTKFDQVSTNPYAKGSQAWQDYENTLPGFPKTKIESTEYLETCSRCRGEGWIDK